MNCSKINSQLFLQGNSPTQGFPQMGVALRFVSGYAGCSDSHLWAELGEIKSRR